MPPELLSLDYPPGSACRSHVRCKPVGKRRYAAWLGDEFLGLAGGGSPIGSRQKRSRSREATRDARMMQTVAALR